MLCKHFAFAIDIKLYGQDPVGLIDWKCANDLDDPSSVDDIMRTKKKNIKINNRCRKM